MDTPNASTVRRVKDERGGTAAEYALIVSLIALVIFAGVVSFGTAVNGLFQLAVDNWP